MPAKLSTISGARSASTTHDLNLNNVPEELSFEEPAEAAPAYDIGTITAIPTQTTTYASVVEILASPLDPANVKERKGFNGEMLRYLDGKYVIKTLNRIFGYGNWGYYTSAVTDMALDPETHIPMAVSANVTLWVQFPGEDGRRAEFSDTGFGENVQPGFWDAEKKIRVLKPRTWGGYEMARKGAVTDALKRCAANLGDQFGLSLKGKEDGPASAGTTSAPSSSTRSGAPTPEAGTGVENTCEVCGEELRGYTTKTGKTYTTADMVKFSLRDTGKVLCYTHKKEHLDNTR